MQTRFANGPWDPKQREGDEKTETKKPYEEFGQKGHKISAPDSGTMPLMKNVIFGRQGSGQQNRRQRQFQEKRRTKSFLRVLGPATKSRELDVLRNSRSRGGLQKKDEKAKTQKAAKKDENGENGQKAEKRDNTKTKKLLRQCVLLTKTLQPRGANHRVAPGLTLLRKIVHAERQNRFLGAETLPFFRIVSIETKEIPSPPQARNFFFHFLVFLRIFCDFIRRTAKALS